MVTLTNSPPNKGGKTPLENAGLADFFERQFSVEAARAYKPAQVLYHMVAQELEVPPPPAAWSRHTSGTRSGRRAPASPPA
jgi:Predicted hydrolase (HAD superfamily)